MNVRVTRVATVSVVHATEIVRMNVIVVAPALNARDAENVILAVKQDAYAVINRYARVTRNVTEQAHVNVVRLSHAITTVNAV